MRPLFEAACKKLGFSDFSYVNVEESDENEALMDKYNVGGFPTLILLDGDRVMARESGNFAYRELSSWLGNGQTAPIPA